MEPYPKDDTGRGRVDPASPEESSVFDQHFARSLRDTVNRASLALLREATETTVAAEQQARACREALDAQRAEIAVERDELLALRERVRAEVDAWGIVLARSEGLAAALEAQREEMQRHVEDLETLIVGVEGPMRHARDAYLAALAALSEPGAVPAEVNVPPTPTELIQPAAGPELLGAIPSHVNGSPPLAEPTAGDAPVAWERLTSRAPSDLENPLAVKERAPGSTSNGRAPAGEAVTVVAARVADLDVLAAFLRGVQAVPGIEQVEARELEAGRATLSVRAMDPQRLGESLRSIPGFAVNRIEADAAGIRVELR